MDFQMHWHDILMERRNFAMSVWTKPPLNRLAGCKKNGLAADTAFDIFVHL